MPQLTDFQRFFIVSVKKDKPDWGKQRMRKEFPIFFKDVTDKQIKTVLKNFAAEGLETRKPGSGAPPIAQEIEDKVISLLQSDKAANRKHLAVRKAADAVGISFKSVTNIAQRKKLKCFRRVKGQILKAIHREKRKLKSSCLLSRFSNKRWRSVWFSDEARFTCSSPVVTQNERVYREVEIKSEIPESDLVIEADTQGPSVLVYAAVSWHGKTDLFFLDANIDQRIYRETCLQKSMFPKIKARMGEKKWCWQQDGATPHTAGLTQTFREDNCPDFIRASEWPSKSPDLKVMDYAIWGLLQTEMSRNRGNLKL